ncbi:MAG: ATP-binding protein [Desulfobacterales bacterium]|nr:ATP-binding protein [Desulfobacterales bacterium]
MYLKRLTDLRHTLAFRLTLWYALIFMISTGVAFFLFYLQITSFLRAQTDQDLLNQARKISSVLTLQGVSAVERSAILESQAAGEKKIFIRLFSPNGSVFSSSNMSYWQNIGIEKEAIEELLQGTRYVFSTLASPDRKLKVRILYTLIGRSLVLQLGEAMETSGQFIEAFRKNFIITISVLLIFAAAIGWFMARKALSGVEVLTRTARHISGGALGSRVPLTRNGDEIDQLATTFNQMLDRIETLVAGVKEMSDNIAHDLKSPVTRIRGIAEVTLTTDPSLTSYENMAASIIEESDRLLDLINTMLVISKTEAGVDRLNIEKLDMTEMVKDACNLFQSSAEDKDIELTRRLSEKQFVRGDKRMIQRMVSNLLDNAIRYTPDQGTVQVSVQSPRQDQVSVMIKDTGIGISSEDLPHIFRRFYRCEPSRSLTGTGLGLSLALAIAKAHGGNIDVGSTLGKGSTFTITLPKDSP